MWRTGEAERTSGLEETVEALAQHLFGNNSLAGEHNVTPENIPEQ
jgi:hypothetical protein